MTAIVFTFATQDAVSTVELSSKLPISSIRVDGRQVEWSLADNQHRHRLRVKPGPIASVILTAEDGTEIRADIPETGLKIEAGQRYTVTAFYGAKSKITDDGILVLLK